MFEKESEEYATKHTYNGDKYTTFEWWYRRNSFQEGATFGYNKANEWHYPSKGKYPKECQNVWCYCKGPGIKFCCVGHTIVGGDNKVRWWANNKTEELLVIAWKEIVLPKEIE